jgi:hypothetical protein
MPGSGAAGLPSEQLEASWPIRDAADAAIQ